MMMSVNGITKKTTDQFFINFMEWLEVDYILSDLDPSHFCV